MTKRKNARPARKPRDRFRDDDDSLLLRSAESLGRVIGALQRQLDGATKRLANSAGDALDHFPSMREIADTVTPTRRSTKRRTPAAKKASTRNSSPQKKGAQKGERKQAPSKKGATSRKR